MTGALATGVNPHLTPALSSREERVVSASEPGEVGDCTGLCLPRKLRVSRLDHV